MSSKETLAFMKFSLICGIKGGISPSKLFNSPVNL